MFQNFNSYLVDNQPEKKFFNLDMVVPIGEIVKQIVSEHKEFTNAGLARAIGVTSRNLDKMYKKNSWDSKYLTAASRYLKRNLYNYILPELEGEAFLVNEPEVKYQPIQQQQHHFSMSFSYSRKQLGEIERFMEKLHELADEHSFKVE